MTAQSLAARPKIKILLYTDDPNAITARNNLLGLSSMIKRLRAHAPVFADLSVKWVSRSSDCDHHADNKLNLVMSQEVERTGEPFDEIWFFGLHQANTEKFSLGVFRGGPESELGVDEVDEIDKWMKVEGGTGGGVLMTGDHNNPVPPRWLPNTNGRCADPVTAPALLGLGRAIGRCVPRAGELRKWDGPPSSQAADCLNTLANDGFQTDRVPQSLIYERVNSDGEPDAHGKPHPLFFYRTGGFINIFPDHRHEGELVIPDTSNTAVWPGGPKGQPKPCIVAFGTDRRSGKKIGLVTTYDGDRAGVGRIVADSSWHHYININLKGFPHPAPPDSYSDKIGQFYGNLAIWLAPLHKRRQMAQAMYRELADYTLLLEQQGDPVRTGEVAYSILGRSASPCEIYELLRAFGQPQFAHLHSSDCWWAVLANTEQQTLGLVLDSYQKAMIRAEQESIPMATFELENSVSRLPRASAAACGSASSAGIGITNDSLKANENFSADTNELEKEWTIEIKRDPQPGKAPFEATLVFKLTNLNGIITGQVWDGVDGQLLSAVTGTYQPSPDGNYQFMTLEFTWGAVNVTLSGEAIETPDTVHFNGRFTASAATATNDNAGTTDESLPITPGEGDTGTGTGQQT